MNKRKMSTDLISNPIPPNQEFPVQPRHSLLRQALRLLEFIIWFSWCCAVVHTNQLLMALTYFISYDLFNTCKVYTKQQFSIILTTVTQWFTPTMIRVSGDSSMRGRIKQDKKGRLITNFEERLVLISNHQIYTEWLYLWWIAYTSGQHGSIYIILKESLKYIPVLGPAMMLYGFIFMARNWATDKVRLAYRLRKLKQSHRGLLSGSKGLDPMWLLMFPEGTNLSANTRKRSVAWANKIGIKDLEHLLLPRSTGLLFCLRNLKDTVEAVYDCSIAYEGIPRGQYAQDLFTLRSTFLAGRPPKSVNMHWRRLPLDDIPLSDPEMFNTWLLEQWQLKDKLIEHYALNGRFPADDEIGFVETAVGLKSLWEIGHVFLATTIIAVLSVIIVASWNRLRWGSAWGAP